MSALTDRIAEVHLAHKRAPDYHSPSGNCAACECGWKGAGYAWHVAERVEAELGLTEFECDGDTWWSTKLYPTKEVS